jgi:hypothetical protein
LTIFSIMAGVPPAPPASLPAAAASGKARRRGPRWHHAHLDLKQQAMQPIRFIALRAVLCAVVTAGLAAGAGAADKAKPPAKPGSGVASLGGGGGGAKDLPILTRNQLRECLAQQDKLHADETEVVAQQRDMDADKAEIAQQGQALQAELAALDRTSASGVQAYNARAVEHERRIDAYNARSKPFNERVEALKTQRAGWAQECSNRRYMENDLIIIKAGR